MGVLPTNVRKLTALCTSCSIRASFGDFHSISVELFIWSIHCGSRCRSSMGALVELAILFSALLRFHFTLCVANEMDGKRSVRIKHLADSVRRVVFFLTK